MLTVWTRIVCDVWPGAKVTVPDICVKSLPEVAVPLAVEQSTIQMSLTFAGSIVRPVGLPPPPEIVQLPWSVPLTVYLKILSVLVLLSTYVLPQLKLEFSCAGVSITPSAGELDECISKRLFGQRLTSA